MGLEKKGCVLVLNMIIAGLFRPEVTQTLSVSVETKAKYQDEYKIHLK